MRITSTSQRIEKLCRLFEETAYSDMGLNPLAAYAVSLLESNGLPTTLENVSVALFRMFPRKFSLPGFEEYPDSARVTRVLLHLTPKYVNWLVGNPTRGYALNDAGRRAASEAAIRLENPNLKQSTKQVLKAPRSKYEKEMNRLRGSSAFKKYLAQRSSEIKVWEVFDLLGAVPYTPAWQLRGRVSELLQLAQDVHDNEAVDFIKSFLQQFPNVFVDKFSDTKKQSGRNGEAKT